MDKSVEVVRGDYRGHSYQVTLTYAHVPGGEKYVTGAKTMVDGTLITLRTPGFVDTGARTKSGVLQEVKAYMDYLEDKQAPV